MAYKDPNDERAKAARRKHYEANKEKYLQNNIKRRLEMRNYVVQAKNVPCMDCKQWYAIWVMEFDHRDPTQKKGNINSLIRNGSWDKLRAEIEKCDVVCANCHRVRTAKMFGWNTDRLLEMNEYVTREYGS